MPQAFLPRLPSLPNKSGILNALQQKTAFMGFPYSDDGPNQSILLAGNLLVSSSFQCLV
jgi:hypothetical protein